MSVAKRLLTQKNLDTGLFGLSAATGSASLGLSLADRIRFRKFRKPKKPEQKKDAKG